MLSFPRTLRIATASALLCSTALFAADDTAATLRVKAHTTFLADDLLEGRGAGTRGYDLAARYVAAQFERLGLAPAGDRNTSFFQTVRLIESRVQSEAAMLALLAGDARIELEPLNEFFATPAPGEETVTLTAPAVFVGYAVHAPNLDYSDFAEIDLRGKVAVFLPGAPSRFPSEVRAHYASLAEKYSQLVQRGAVGAVTLITPLEEQRYPWAMTLNAQRFRAMRLVGADGAIIDGFPQLRIRTTVRRSSAAKLFAQTGRKIDDVFAAADRSEPQAFDLNVTLILSAAAEVSRQTSANVLGWLPGSDATLASEPVVFTAHLDHVGIGAPVNGDAIYNGAMDNAIGVATLLAVAEELAGQPRLRRPVLFAALTAEEKGLLGAYHLAAHLPSGATRFAANVNVDMPTFPAGTRDVIAWGAEHSTLGAVIEAAAADRKFSLSADPWPEETIFVRSDQYPFVRAGIPAIYLGTGIKPLDSHIDLAALTDQLFRERYHKPSDDLTQPVDWPSAGAFAELAAELTRRIANDAHAPTWHAESFFGQLFDQRAAR